MLNISPVLGKTPRFGNSVYLYGLGPDTVQSELLKGYPSALVATDMASAVVNAIKSMCLTLNNKSRPRIALLTPYRTSVHYKNVEYFTKNEIDVVIGHNLGFNADKTTSAMTPESIFEHAKCLANLRSDVDVVFIGCSGMRATGSYLNIFSGSLKM